VFRSKLHHVGIIVADEQQVQTLIALLGLTAGHEEYVPEYEAQCYFTRGTGQSPAIEFIVSRPGGKLSKFNKGFGGIHHIALEVDDLERATAELRAQGVSLLEQTPVVAGDIRINFVPPLYTRGFIVELIEPITGAIVRTQLDEPPQGPAPS
jgi:methylmalonyl-CoA/ethylmalonyl-CoA epimerase